MKVNQNHWRDRLYSSYLSNTQSDEPAPSEAKTLFAPRKAHFDHIIRRHIAVPKDTQILDLGCGHGIIVYLLRQHGYTQISGVDGSPEQVELARRLGIAGVELGDIMDYLAKTPDGSAGVVLLMDVLEHFTREQAFEVLDEIFRVLRPGGKCIIHVPNAEGIFGMRIHYGDITHEQSFTRDSASQLLKSIGFDKISGHEDKPMPHGLKSAVRRLIWEVGTLPYRLLLAAENGTGGAILSQNLLVVAYKPGLRNGG